MRRSRKRYVQAISALMAALQDPVEVKSDETLYAVLLFCGYEVSLFSLLAMPTIHIRHIRAKDDSFVGSSEVILTFITDHYV